MKNAILVGFCLLSLHACTVDKTAHSLNDSEKKEIDAYKNLAAIHQVSIASDEEPGEKLVLCIQLVDKQTGNVLPDQRIYLYHTSNTGDYELSDPGDESSARLHGSAVADSLGRIIVKTILPGDYGTSSNNRHIHTTIDGAHPEAYDIHFKQYTGFMGNRFIQNSDQHFLADLKRSETGTLVAFVKIEVKQPSSNQ